MRASAAPPVAEFLVAAGDSTYWVRSGPTGIRVRSAPILLTRADGQFHEVYIIEDGVDYADASFGMARVYSHRLIGEDSLLLFQDSTVVRQAAAWKRRHPGEQAIGPDADELLQDPGTQAIEEIEIVDVHGPWLTFVHSLDVDTESGETHQHRARQAVVDVRTGKLATLEGLFGSGESRRLVVDARSSLDRLIDSVRTAGDDRAQLARETLASFRFDSTSFAIADIARAPAVSFMVPGRDADGEALALYLPPIRVAPPPWWPSVQPTLPVWTRDSGEVHWEQQGYRVFARPSTDGESMALVLQARASRDGVTDSTGLASGANASARSRQREWPIATVAAPAYGLIALDAPGIDAVTRSALARAFDMSTALDGLAQRVAFSNGATPRVAKAKRRDSPRSRGRYTRRSH